MDASYARGTIRAWKAQAKKYVTSKKLNTDGKYQNAEKPKEIQGGLTPLWQIAPTEST